jgi:hypothetical protein
MKLRVLSAATIACWMLAAVTPASAGYWNYGCKGSIGDTTVTFDRNAFLIMPKALARGRHRRAGQQRNLCLRGRR